MDNHQAIKPIGSGAAAVPRLWYRQLREMLTIMLRHPWLLAAAVLPNVITPALAPIQAWLAKEVLGQVAQGEQLFQVDELLAYAPYAIAIFFGIGLLTLAEKLTNRMFDDRLLIELQRTWFERRGRGCVGEQVACSINDCENARKILDLFQKELWMVLVGLPAVILWQLSLAPELLPALLMASLLPFLAALLFGGLLQRYSLNSLRLVAGVGSAVARGDRQRLYRCQELFYINRIKFELSKQGSEVMADFAYWLSLVLLLVLTVSGIWPLLPQELSAAAIGVFLINLKLINKPLSQITKVYNKVREGWPAVGRVLNPEQQTGVHHD
ncbi:hypothetical protein [Zobellella iuensis]|uniref:ABC transmembrane type-1 domain-containing protein n=1 Tax=Zobellella iuensis TaxID=2803811 RepID=A0ABS1QYI8_9GAMM|nr:hypothetical protein [Zobellella iuensis]MBL1379501.1 hypothetical protein [Zobellella iuensis]